MKIWLARDSTPTFDECETCLFFGSKPELDQYGIWIGKKPRWPVPPLGRLLAPGDIVEMAIEVEFKPLKTKPKTIHGKSKTTKTKTRSR